MRFEQYLSRFPQASPHPRLEDPLDASVELYFPGCLIRLPQGASDIPGDLLALLSDGKAVWSQPMLF